MENSLSTIKNYFNSCLAEDCEPSFEEFIVKHAQHIIANLNKSQSPYSGLSALFINHAKALGIKAKKRAAQKAWQKHVESDQVCTRSKMLCPVEEDEVEEEEEVKGEWKAGEHDVVTLFNQERKTTLSEKKSGKFTTEQRYLLLSFILEVPLSTKNFVFGFEDHCLKMMRAELLPQTKKAQFEQDILVMFLNDYSQTY
ncbi:hypothetical protein BD560DRAFT_451240 [Blakeslea trispora]|nr:hypothetical protein BD560DRAFT_451240 [Blakeslea trispora]